MMIPLILLCRPAPCCSAALFYGSFVGEGAHAFWHETIFVGEHASEGITRSG